MVTNPRRCKRERQGRSTPGSNPTPGRQRILNLRNRQQRRRVDARLLRQIVQALLCEKWPDGSFDLSIYLVAVPEITRLNETFLNHKGSTDVITFDYAEKVGQPSRLSRFPRPRSRSRDRRDACQTRLHGELFVCLDEAVDQARRFHTTWQRELVRYVVHGLLHLLGYDDRNPQARRRMKAAEDAHVRRLASQFSFRALSRPRAGSNS